MQPVVALKKNESAHDAGLLINLLDPENILLWSAQLVVSPIELKLAVAKVGSSVASVRAYFGLSAFDVWPEVANQIEAATSLPRKLAAYQLSDGAQHLSAA